MLAIAAWRWRKLTVQTHGFRVIVPEFSEAGSLEKPTDRIMGLRFRDELRQAANAEKGFEVIFPDEVVANPDTATCLGKSMQATIVVFGYFDTSESHGYHRISFEVIEQPRYSYPLRRRLAEWLRNPFRSATLLHYHPAALPKQIVASERRVSIQELNSFEIHITLAQELTYLLLGLYRYWHRDYAGAIRVCERALSLRAKSNDEHNLRIIHGLIGRFAYLSGDAPRAIEEYRAVLESAPDSAKDWYNLGAACLAGGEYRQALNSFGRAVNLDRDFLLAYRGRATVRLYLDEDEYDAAITDCSYVLQKEPDNVIMLALRAEWYRRAGKHNEAITDLCNALAYKPRDASMQVDLLAGLVNEHIALKKPRTAMQYCRKLARRPNSRAYAYGRMGDISVQSKDHYAAIEMYTRAIALDSRSPYLLCERGNQWWNLGDRVHASADYTAALSYNPKLAWVYYNQGNTYTRQQEFRKATDYYTVAVRLEDHSQTGILLSALFNRGQIYCEMRQYTQALVDFDRCLELGSTDYRVTFYKGLALLALHRFEDAILNLQVALSRRPEAQDTRKYLGTAHYSLACKIVEDWGNEAARCQATKVSCHLISAVELDPGLEEHIQTNPALLYFLAQGNHM
jgi:tetratricopeptide (TPR) repeat protein